MNETFSTAVARLLVEAYLKDVAHETPDQLAVHDWLAAVTARIRARWNEECFSEEAAVINRRVVRHVRESPGGSFTSCELECGHVTTGLVPWAVDECVRCGACERIDSDRKERQVNKLANPAYRHDPRDDAWDKFSEQTTARASLEWARRLHDEQIKAFSAGFDAGFESRDRAHFHDGNSVKFFREQLGRLVCDDKDATFSLIIDRLEALKRDNKL